MYISEMQPDAALLYGFKVDEKNAKWDIFEPAILETHDLSLECMNSPEPLRQLLKSRHKIVLTSPVFF